MRLLEKEFYENLNLFTDIFVRKYINDQNFTFNNFKNRVIDYLMDEYHDVLSDGGLNDFPYNEIYEFLSNHFHDKIKERYELILNRGINESVPYERIIRESDTPIQIRRRLGTINRLIDVVVDDMYVCEYNDENHFVEGVVFELGWLVRNDEFGLNELDWMDIYEYLEKHRTDDIKEYFNERRGGCIDDLNESENKKSGLLRSIEVNGLFQVIQDTGLSLQQIISKTGELPREVLERYIRDFINEEGYHQTNGDTVFYLSVVLSKDKIAESFYLSGDKVTAEVNEYGKYSVQIGGFMESLSNFTDEEIYMVAKGMIDWGGDTYYEI